MELKKIIEIVFRRKWIILQSLIIIFLTSIVVSFFMTPIYETSSKLLIKKSTTASSFLASIGLPSITRVSSDQSETETQNQITMASSALILDEVISRLQLKDDNGNLKKSKELLESNIILSKIFPKPCVEIGRIEDSDLIEVKVSSPSPEEATMIANTLAEIWIQESLQQRRMEYTSARDFIGEQIESSRAAYLEILESVKNFKIKEQTLDLPRETDLVINKIAELMSEQENNVHQLSEAMAKLETLKAQLSRQGEIMVSSSTISENPQIEYLKKMITDFEMQLAGLSTEKTKDHPDVKTIQKKLQEAKEDLIYEVSIFQKSSKNLEDLEREVAGLKAQSKCIEKDIKKYLSLLYTLPAKTLTQSQLELKLSVNEKLYSSLLEYLYQIGMAEAMTLSDIKLVEAAAEPDINKPESPNKVLNGIMGIFLGLLFGFSTAFLIDYLDDTIKSAEEVKEFEITFLGIIPRSRKKDSAVIFNREPTDPLCEAYRTVRNSIRFASLDKPIKTLIITSAIQGEGKTTTVADLGIFIAREGKKVLLVDTDLRKPSLHRIFKESNSIGIVNVLAEDVKLTEAIKKTKIENLNILLSGTIPPDPGLLTESEKMRQLIKDLQKQYDLVILDSPPMLLANDTIIMAEYIDALVLVMETGRVTHRAIKQVLGLLKQANIKPIGALLNKFKIGRTSYYYSYYYKKGYYQNNKK